MERNQTLLMNRRVGTAIIINILNLLDLALTLIGTQIPHIDFINTEKNPIFVSTYSDLLAGNPIPFLLIAILLKLIIGILYAIYVVRFERCLPLALVFGVVFSSYSITSFVWILLIFGVEPPSQLAINFTLVVLFVISFFIYYDHTEIKENLRAIL